MGTAEGSTKSLPLRLSFVMSAYNTAQRMIRFSDEEASFFFLFFGILSIFGIRGDRILLILGGRARAGSFRALLILLFLATMILSLFHGLQTIAPRLVSRVKNPSHWRLHWCHDVLRYPVEEYPTHLRALSDDAVLQEMVHELYTAMTIEEMSSIGSCVACAGPW
jgi:hypothetical protein